MSQHEVLCNQDSNEIIALANRLNGEFVNYQVCDRGFIFSFKFPSESFKEQFILASHWYSEVEAIAS